MAKVELTDVCKSFGKTQVLNDINLEVAPGEFCVFVGPSGCGKSTLLRMIAGLEDVTSGDILIGHKRVNDVPSKDRGISMVFQSYALFPHKTVYENIAYGLRISKQPKDEIDRKVKEAAKVLKLDSLLERKPAHLSGGQRQRVAIGRSIVRDPDVFLFDEPLSNLDAALRVTMRTEIAQLHGRLDATMIYVTHDQVEAMTLADKIVVLNGGTIEQVGSPIDLYHRPVSTFVAQFIGSPRMNLLAAGELSELGRKHAQSEQNLLGVRPEHLDIVEDEQALIKVTATHSENLGEFRLGYFRTSLGQELVAKVYSESRIEEGMTVALGSTVERLHRFDSETGLRVE